MKKELLIAMIFGWTLMTVSQVSALAQDLTTDQSNRVAHVFAEMIVRSESRIHEAIEDGDGSTTNLNGITLAELYNIKPTPEWTADDSRNLLYWYLNDFKNRDSRTDDKSDRLVAVNLLEFLMEQGDTNAAFFARGILSSPNAACKREALNVYLRCVRPTMTENRFVQFELHQIVPNVDVLERYAQKLMVMDRVSDYCVITNGACILYDAVTNRLGAIEVDALWTMIHPSYAISSNRLSLAMKALRDDDASECFHEYFAPITNRLLSIQGPLPEVEGLR